MKVHTSSRKVRAFCGILFACAIVAAAVSTIQCAPKYTCTLEDIDNFSKVQSWVIEDIERKDIKLTDEMEIILYFDHRLNSSEVSQMEEVVVVFRRDSEYGMGWPTSWIYSARCVVQDICRLADMDMVMQIGSGEGEPSIP